MVVVFLGGCTPDSIEVTSEEAIQGKTGHLIKGSLGGGDVATKTVLAVEGAAVTGAPVYVIFEHRSADGMTAIDTAIRSLNRATDIIPVDTVPPNTRTFLFGETQQFVCHLRIWEPGKPESYLSIRLPSWMSDEFRDMVAKGPGVIGGERDLSFVEWLRQEPVGPAPAYIEEITYVIDYPIKPIELDIAVVRRQQERLVRSVYGDDYQSDLALHRALRVVDRINERYGQSYLSYLVHQDIQRANNEREKILQEETRLSHYTGAFIWSALLPYFEENLQPRPGTVYGITTEYLRLHFTYPQKNKDQLVEQFYQSIDNGRCITKNPWYKL